MSLEYGVAYEVDFKRQNMTDWRPFSAGRNFETLEEAQDVIAEWVSEYPNVAFRIVKVWGVWETVHEQH